jgi:ABC-type uncharacterized transport system ATPase subunit
MNAAGKTSPIFSFGTNILSFMQSKGDAITGGGSVSVICTGYIGYQQSCRKLYRHLLFLEWISQVASTVKNGFSG